MSEPEALGVTAATYPGTSMLLPVQTRTRTPRAARILCLLAILKLGIGHATTTVCSHEESQRFHYGDKSTLLFKTGKPDFNDAAQSMFMDFGRKSGMNYSAVGPTSLRGKIQPNSSTVLMQSTPSFDVLITIEAAGRPGVARATISTFSFSCTATEDWRPYWAKLKSYLAVQHLELVQGKMK